jgi:vacuolar-type H+-ATPase subunit I/STV1
MISEPRDVASPKAHDFQRAQLLKRKQTFLSQFKSGGRMGRKIEDIADETRLSPQIFALAKAQATGNPLALEKIKLEYEIKNLTLLARSNRLDHYNNRQQLLDVEYRIAHLQGKLPQLKKASETFKSHERRDDEGKLLSLQVRFNGLEFSKLKDANEYLRTVTIDSTTQLTVNGLDIPLAVSDALIKDELGTITDITTVRYNLAGEWFDVPRSEAHMGLPSAQSLLTSVLRRGGDLPAKILETEATIQANEATLARLHTALDYQSPYETKLKEYEQRLAEIDKELLGKTEEAEELVDAETEELPSSRALSSNHESDRTKGHVHAATVEEQSPAQVAANDAPDKALDVPAKQAPRFKRKQTADLGR